MHLITCIGDVHVGHPAAVWPKGYETDKGNPIGQNKAQEKLWQYWTEFWNHPLVRESEYVINLAECIEGPNRKEIGRGLMGDVSVQKDAFVKLMAPHIKGRHYIQLVGSDYHGLQGYSIEQDICAGLQIAEPSAKITFGGHIMRWKHKPSGKYFILTHKLSNALQYKVTALDKWSLYVSAIKSKIGDPDCIIGAHHHQYFAEKTPSRLIVQLPSFKCWHPIKDASRYPFTQPTIGGVVIRIEDDGYVGDRLIKFPTEHLFDAVVRL